MACGTPVVTSRGGATEETAGGAAVLVDPYDAGSIAAGIAEAVDDAPSCAASAPSAPVPSRGTRRHAPWSRSTARWPDEPSSSSTPTCSVAGAPATRPTSSTSCGTCPLRRPAFASPRSRASRSSSQTASSRCTCPRAQELRMAWSVPRTLTKLRPALAHFQHALPLRCPCPAVVTIHDLSFERDPSVCRRRPPRLQDRRAALGQARRARPRRVGADEGRPRRAVRHRAGEDHRHATRRGSRVLAGRRRSRQVPVVGADLSRNARTRWPRQRAASERRAAARRRRARDATAGSRESSSGAAPSSAAT